MRKSVLFIWNICLLALVPLLVGCNKDDDKTDLIFVESFVGTDGMEGEKIIQELKDVPAVVRYESNGYVSLCYSEYADEYYIDKNSLHSSDIINTLIAIKASTFESLDLSVNSKVYVSAYITNIARYFEDSVLDDDWFWYPSRTFQRKAYLKDIKERN